MSFGFATSEVDLAMPLLAQASVRSAASNVAALSNDEQDEVLRFLSGRPIHTVCMASYIRDHGVVSPLNRGTFYGYRNRAGNLKGVALIGHATLFETQSDKALKAFAELNHQYGTSHLVRAEHKLISRFWKHYSAFGDTPRLACRELLFEQTRVPSAVGEVPQLRLATLDDLASITQINAAMLFAECGINPLKSDPIGFLNRIVRRIRSGRVYVWEHGNRLLFKADIFAETPEMIYLEGINVHPLERGKGHGLRCMAQLGTLLLRRSNAICLLVNREKKELTNFYLKAGYECRGRYDTIYLDIHTN
jgi:predicted GNAT family acetyltransferase